MTNNCKISVIVPVYNMYQTIGATLNSIFDQNYPNLELIVVDGGSNDGTYEYLNGKKENIDILISEDDNGQYDAINKGMNLATGEVVTWLNADDKYFPWTLNKVSKFFSDFENIDWITGLPSFLEKDGSLRNIYSNISARHSSHISRGLFRDEVFGWLQQESIFFRKSLWDKVGGLDLNFKLAADFNLWVRFARHSELISVGIPLASFRVDENSRSKKFAKEYKDEVKTYMRTIKSKKKIIDFIFYFKFLKNIFGFLIWKKQKLIFYSNRRKRWELKSRYRPVSQIGFLNLLLEI